MNLRLLLLVVLAVSIASLTVVSSVSSQDDGGDTSEASIGVELPSEFVVTEEHPVRVSVESSREVESSKLVMSVNGERQTEAEADSDVLKIRYTPEDIGELEFEFTVDVRFEDGGEATLHASRTVPPENVLDHRVWRGVAMPVPEKFEEQVGDAAANRSLPRGNETMFWGPTTGDGTMYALLTDERVEYGPFAMVGSLATQREERDHVVQGEFVLCFYNANYPVFYDEPAVETPSSDEVEHGDVVAFDLKVEEVVDGFYEYRGNGTEESVVFVDHSDVLEGDPSGEVVRGAVVDVPFAHSFYPEQYGVDADFYVYPMETVNSSEVPVAGDGIQVVSGEANLEVLQTWGVGVEEEDYRSPSGPVEPTTGYEDGRDAEEGSDTRSEESNRSRPGQPQHIEVTVLLASIAAILFLRSKE